jgi:glycosyltransferase-like protein
VDAIQVPNGVDTQHFGPRGEARDARVRERLGITGAPVFLSVGGVEARKNTLCTLNAFLQLRRRLPHAQLVIAGGASLLDHHDYRQAFDSVVRDRGVESGPGRALLLTGTVPDADMPALYRSADALVFPSLLEGFGLVVLEAMASGVPAIVSRLAPFVEYLSDGDCLWVDPRDTYSVADAMQRACDPQHALALRRAGLRVAQRFGWRQSALRHLPVYQTRAAAGEVAHA